MYKNKSLLIDIHPTVFYGIKIRLFLYKNGIHLKHNCILTCSSAVLCVSFSTRQHLPVICCLNPIGREKIHERIRVKANEGKKCEYFYVCYEASN